MATYEIVQLDAASPQDEAVAHRLKVVAEYWADVTNRNGDRFVFRAPAARDDPALLRQEIEALVPTADFLITLRQPVARSLIQAGAKLRLIQKLGLWHDSIDSAAAAERGIPVSVSPHFGCTNVAEHTLLLMLALSRRLIKLHASTVAGENPHQLAPLVTTQWQRYFNWQRLPANDFATLSGRTLGLVGLGEIGGEVARRARAFGMNLLYTKRHRLAPQLEAEHGVTYVSLPDLLANADFVSLHLQQRADTEKLISARELDLMKPSAFFINTSRGNLVDEPALIQALQTGRIAGAGLDVFSVEPLPADHPLTRLPNVVLTPHVGAVAPVIMWYQRAFQNIQRVAEGLPAWDRVA